MDKRALLAIILSGLVVVAFQMWLDKMQGKKSTFVPPKKVAQKLKKETMLSLPKQTPKAKEAKGYKAEEIMVDTSLYKAILTEAGGRFKSFALKKYLQTLDPHSPPVNLISAPKQGLPIEIYPAQAPELGVSLFHANPISLSLNQGQEGMVFFESLDKKPLIINKEISFRDGSYLMDLKVKVKNPSDKPRVDTLLFRLVASPIGKANRYTFRGPAYSHEGSLENVKLRKPGKFSEYVGLMDWAGYSDLYFLMAMIPPQEEAWRATFRRLDKKVSEVILWSPQFTLPPQGEKSFDLKLYFGPKSLEILKNYGYNLKSCVHFGFFDPLAKPLLYCMQFFYKYCHNYGIAIILLTFLIRVVFWPLNHFSFKSMRKMQELQPLIVKLKEKYGDDKARLNQELMRLYKTYKVNPFMGCIPMILQIPVFFALYKVLLMAIELRHAPFWGWIKDLSAPDRLYIGFHIPFLGGLPVLTILMGVSMYFQQKLSPTAIDPTQKQMMLVLPVFFTFLFVNFPSGLVLYWLVNNILSIVQQYMTQKMVIRSK